ncbi:JNK1/MAPK8-associated membrane protein-like [Amphiura filiformis]|uniref:JNK1/MAPK8-associated membrane protein-like n=1 Tax=Amphiura filiformis TaxID=82378 RepID=UPI003B211114
MAGMKAEFLVYLLMLIWVQSNGSKYVYDPLKPITSPELIDGNISTCPGLYCGRITVYNDSNHNDFTFSQCGPCPRGESADKMSICQPCGDTPSLYDWLYLGFMVILSLTLHFFFIDYFFKEDNKTVIALHVSAFFECFLAAIISLLIVQPVGKLDLYSCGVRRLSDWYTMMKNPKPDYTTQLHCTQEAVYPLYTLIFLSYTFQLIFMMLFRPFLSVKLCKNQGKNSIYAALYFLPILVVIHAVCAGLIYYSYPHIIIIVSLVTHAVHFSRTEINTPKQLLSKKRNVIILIAHWLIHGYGIIAITRLQNPTVHASLLILVPIPAIFFIATAQFTEPNKISDYES